MEARGGEEGGGGRVEGSIGGVASSVDAWWGVSSRVGAVWGRFLGRADDDLFMEVKDYLNFL